MEIKLNERPDGSGYFYGTIRTENTVYNLNILPPEKHWKGDIKPSDDRLSKTDWIIYVDGEEHARVKERSEVEESLKLLISNQSNEPE